MIKHNLTKGVESALNMLPILLCIHHLVHPLSSQAGEKQQTPMQHKTAWALETGIIRDNYMICVFILISAKSRIGAKAFFDRRL